MKVTIKKLVKCVSQSGRRALVRELLEEQLTKDALVSGACKAVTKGINDGVNKLKDKSQLVRVHKGLACLHDSVGTVLDATNPKSDAGMKISKGETKTIISGIGTATDAILTDDTVGKLREYIISKVP